MTTVRRIIREKAFQSLFQLSTDEALSTDMAIQQALESEIDEDDLSQEEAMKLSLPKDKNQDPIINDAIEYLNTLVYGIEEYKEEIDKNISKHLRKWTISRLERINLLILRIGVYELLYQEEIPSRIVINEAIELTKLYNDEKSSKFVNGVLQSVLDSKEA